MRRIKLVVAYDGTNYHGWQLQPNAVTVEGEINKALSAMLQADIRIIGASRTDAGVHALGNVAVFDTESRIPGEKFSYALNARLPEDIRILSSCETDPDFHPRFDCHNKTYEYRITRSEFMLPTKRLYSHHVYCKLDVEKMKQAAAFFIGEHDFASFCSAGSSVEDTVRTVYWFEIDEDGADLILRINGNGFLYNMVRIIAGTLLNVGCGKMTVEACRQAIEGDNRSLAGPTAPARGLCLTEINYKTNI
ncbi:MAG: tRNA pseudouridine(38-40) synthase TruA [Lachnospiraceae bacterium]